MHVVDVSPFVQILDVPVPQMGDQLVEFMKRLDTLTPEQVIAVPKISQDRIPQRFVGRDWRILDFLQQKVDIPVPRTRGFLPDPGSAAPSAVSRDELGQGVFRTFPVRKKCGVRRKFECEGVWALELFELSVHQMVRPAVQRPFTEGAYDDSGTAGGWPLRPGPRSHGVMAVAVIMQLQFQQSFLFMFLEVPQIQFNYRVPDVPVACS